MLSKYFVLLGVVVLLFLSCQAGPETKWTLLNLDRTIRYTLQLNGSELYYQVDYLKNANDEIPVVKPSPMGLICKGQDLTTGFSFLRKSNVRTMDETYPKLTGKQRQVHHHGVEQSFTFQNAKGTEFMVMVRSYADGVAFRYGIAGNTAGSDTLTGEVTGFKVPPEGQTWMLPYSKVDTWAPAYEEEWQNKIPVGQAAPETVGWSFPALFQVNDCWLLLTEAGLDTNCYGAHLEQNPDSGLYRIRLPEPEETYGVAPQEVAIAFPWHSPWRALIIGETPGTIMESVMVENLSAPSVLDDVSWIKPGRVSWSWWSAPDSPNNYAKLVPFIDLAARLGWEYSLIDLGWHEMTNGGDIQQLNAYAQSQGVDLILWYNSGGPHNQVPNACPCEIMHDPVKRREEMARIQSWGIKGIKVDFMQSDKQYVMKLYQDIARDAADHHLMVNFHGATVPRGWTRTYPNIMTMEGIRGGEQYWDLNFSENAHMFHTIYTFTRNVVGSMDYTPVIFGEAPGKIPHKTTNAHELATSVAFESGWQHFIDTPQSYLAQPDYVVDFLGSVPVVWDETRYVGGKPGELSIMARRHENEWYLAGLNGEVKQKSVRIPLAFLGAGTYECLLITDGEHPRSFQGSSREVGSDTILTVELAERGGFAARMRLKNE